MNKVYQKYNFYSKLYYLIPNNHNITKLLFACYQNMFCYLVRKLCEMINVKITILLAGGHINRKMKTQRAIKLKKAEIERNIHFNKCFPFISCGVMDRAFFMHTTKNFIFVNVAMFYMYNICCWERATLLKLRILQYISEY